MATRSDMLAEISLVFTVPAETIPCGDALPTQVSFNGQTAAFAFTYSTVNAPTVASLSINNASPVLKTPLTITGTNYGADTSKVHVYLYEAGVKKYTLNVLSSTATEIQCTLGGG